MDVEGDFPVLYAKDCILDHVGGIVEIRSTAADLARIREAVFNMKSVNQKAAHVLQQQNYSTELDEKLWRALIDDTFPRGRYLQV